MRIRHFGLFVIGVATLALSSQVWATTFYVTNNADVGFGSLRNTLANAHDGDTIKFQPNVTTVNLTSGELVIDKSVTIIGKTFYRTTIQRDSGAATMFRVLHAGPGTSATHRATIVLQNLRITGGDQADNSGGAIFIDEHTDLTITDSVLASNHAKHYGGAINVTATASLTMARCTLDSNSADDWGGAVAIPYGGNAQIESSTFVRNTSPEGGALVAQTHDNNNDGNPGNVDLHIVNSTFNANSGSITSAIELVRSYDRSGGDGQSVNLNASLNNLTISDNTGPAAIQTANYPGGTLQVSLNGSIINDGTATLTGPNISASDNIFSDAPTLAGGSNNQTNTDPALTILGNFAGPTQTMEPKPGSPAIDAMVCANAPQLDQRGVIRPNPTSTSATPCDIGAVELNSPFDEIFKDGFE